MRAALHVLQTAVEPTAIMCDCLSVVNAIKLLLAHREDPDLSQGSIAAISEKTADHHIWVKIAVQIDAGSTQVLSHRVGPFSLK